MSRLPIVLAFNIAFKLSQAAFTGGRILTLATCLTVVADLAVGAPAIVNVSATPSVIPIGSNVPVTFAATISDPSLIPGSVQLIQYDQAGNALRAIGLLHDDGMDGDATAADNVYSLQTSVSNDTAGEVNLRISAAFRGMLRRLISLPLSVTVRPDQKVIDVATQIILAVPDAGASVEVINTAVSGQAPYLDIRYSTSAGTSPSSAFRLIIDANPGKLTLPAWFSENVDSTGVLVSSGAFVQRTSPNGAQSFVLVGPIPSSYQDGPVEDGYLMLPGDFRVFTIVSSDESPLYQLGYSAVQVRQLARQILLSVQTP